MKVKCKICKDELDTSTSGFNDSANKCEKCNEYFCAKHIYWGNHNCKAVNKEILKKEKKKLETGRIIVTLIGFLALYGSIRSSSSDTYPIINIGFGITAIIMGLIYWKYDSIKKWLKL